MIFCIILISINFISCRNNFTPWGIWNKYNISQAKNDDILVRKLKDGNYYEISLGGLYIIKQGNELFKALRRSIPIMAIQGEYTKIEKYEVISDGYVFYLVGDGFKYTSEGTIFQNDTHIQVKMHFINKDECYFEYISREDSNGFHLSYFPEENLIYRRFRIR
jgi:hypothetical protein